MVDDVVVVVVVVIMEVAASKITARFSCKICGLSRRAFAEVETTPRLDTAASKIRPGFMWK